MERVVIIGSGPAGLTAAIYAGRANLSPLVITGTTVGGQIALTGDVENYPGFPEGVSGAELPNRMRQQAERFGMRTQTDEIVEVDLSQHPFVLKGREQEYQTQALIVATGASPRKLGVPGEKEFVGKGVSYCATCDGFFYKEKEVAVVGGGDVAVEEAIFLTKFASKVFIIHRRDRLRAAQITQDRAQSNERIAFVWDSVVEEILGDAQQGVSAVKLKNVKTEEISELPVHGVFVFVGYTPNTQLFKGQLELNEQGYIKSDRRMRTNVPGVFAAGDVQDPFYHQISTALGSATIAAIEAERFIAELEHRSYPG